VNREYLLHNKDLIPPKSFFDRIILDIPLSAWKKLIHEEPILKRVLMEGFSARSHKLPQLLRQPQFQVRLRRFLRAQPDTLDALLNIWGQEQVPTMAFLEMLDYSFVLDHWKNLKDLLGPERFWAGLYLLGYLADERIEQRISEDFWKRHIEPEVIDPLIPIWSLWKDFVREYPDAQDWVKDLFPNMEPESVAFQSHLKENAIIGESTDKNLHQRLRREEERRHKLERKLGKVREEIEHFREELNRYRQENEALRKQVADCEKTFDHRLQNALHQQRVQWFKRYHDAGIMDEPSLERAQERLDVLLKRAERAFELQRQADEQYGLVTVVRQQLLQIELHLKEMEGIYADSLVVHPEISKTKESLLQEKKRILSLPGVEKIFQKDPPLKLQNDLRQKLRFWEAIPENLPKTLQLQDIMNRLDSLGLVEGAQSFQEEIALKKRQILEALYTWFQPESHGKAYFRPFQNFEDFVQSGQSKNYDVYVDGYNIILKDHGKRTTGSAFSLTTLREQFIAAVSRKSHLFRKIYLVFDGIEDYRDLRGNMTVVYSDKTRAITADAVIIQSIKKQKDKCALLVTADQEILNAVEKKIYAVVNPYHFFAFVFDIDLPIIPQN
jgi:hypothetical protein